MPACKSQPALFPSNKIVPVSGASSKVSFQVCSYYVQYEFAFCRGTGYGIAQEETDSGWTSLFEKVARMLPVYSRVQAYWGYRELFAPRTDHIDHDPSICSRSSTP